MLVPSVRRAVIAPLAREVRDLGARVEVGGGDAGREPGLELQPADLPEALGDRLAFGLREPAEPAARAASLGQQLVDEGPVGLRERRRVVAVDEVDPLRPRLGQQRGPLERALAPAEDQHAAAGEAREVDGPDGVGPLLRREALHHERRLDREEGDAGRRDDAIGAEDGGAGGRGRSLGRSRAVVEMSGERTLFLNADVRHAPPQRLDPLLSAEPVAYAMNVSTGIGSSSHPPVNVSNVCTPAASRCHSRPDRSSIPSGMLRRQNRIGSPTTVTDSPCRRASAATARPYGPAPMTSSSMRRRILAACD